MKALRTIGILVLVAGLLLGSVGTVFAEKPSDVPRGKGLNQGQKRGFAGNVTGVTAGNVTILTEEGPVDVMLPEEARYKIPRVMNKWGNLTAFTNTLGGDLSTALFERRVVALAGNSTGGWEALKLMLLPVPGLPPIHAHRTGNVTDFTGADGNITIEDVHGVSHTFVVDGNTTYRTKELGEVPEPPGDLIGSFVTVVIKGNPKLASAKAKVIVVHPEIPVDWPTP